jgi:sensor histidine kinase YesM
MITFLFHHFFAARSREIEADRRATEAQLRLLQAQIEPHFLFNTLANVIRR